MVMQMRRMGGLLSEDPKAAHAGEGRKRRRGAGTHREAAFQWAAGSGCPPHARPLGREATFPAVRRRGAEHGPPREAGEGGRGSAEEGRVEAGAVPEID